MVGSMTAVVLPRVIATPEGKPKRPGAIDTQLRALQIARDPSSWDDQEASATAVRFDDLAAVWDAERASYRPAPLADALARGGPWPVGQCIEIGSGTGVLTPLVSAQWKDTVCVDISAAMLARSRWRARVQADGARLPFRTASAAAVVIGDAPLFAHEVTRVLDGSGVMIWVNALGSDAPYYLPTSEITLALERATAGSWSSVESQALWGSWAVLRHG